MSDSLVHVRRRIARIEGRRPLGGLKAAPCVPTGHAGIDQALGGGIMRGQLHEFLVERNEASSGTGFAAILTKVIGGEVLWLSEDACWRQTGALYMPGLSAIGIDPSRVIMGVLPDAAKVLRAAGDGLRCPALGMVVMTLCGDPRALDLTATRRLALAAEKSGVTALMLRMGSNPAPSAARTRWRVQAAPSKPLSANAPGHPAWKITLLRQRGRPDGLSWHVEWNREHGRLRDAHPRPWATLPGAVVPLSFNRQAGEELPLRRAG